MLHGIAQSTSSGPLGWLLASLLHLPRNGSVSASITTRIEGDALAFNRRFGSEHVDTTITEVDGHLVEKLGSLSLWFEATPSAPDRMELHLRHWGVGPLRWSTRSVLAIHSQSVRDDVGLWSRVTVLLFGGRIGRLQYEVELEDRTLSLDGQS